MADQAHDKRQVNGPIPFVSTIPTGSAGYLLQQILILSNIARCLFARSGSMFWQAGVEAREAKCPGFGGDLWTAGEKTQRGHHTEA